MRLAERLPVVPIDTLREQWIMLAQLESQIVRIEQRLLAWMKQDQASKRISAIPWRWPTYGDSRRGNDGGCQSIPVWTRVRRLAWLGPAQTGTGGRVRLMGISKRGDTYLRTLLIPGASAVLMHAKEPGKWLEDLARLRPPSVVTVALANKIARAIWALLAHDREYEKEHVSVRPV
jgi:transposase